MGGIIGTERPTEGPIWTMMNDTHAQSKLIIEGDVGRAVPGRGGPSEPGDLFV